MLTQPAIFFDAHAVRRRAEGEENILGRPDVRMHHINPSDTAGLIGSQRSSTFNADAPGIRRMPQWQRRGDSSRFDTTHSRGRTLQTLIELLARCIAPANLVSAIVTRWY